jgi:glycosyltransferase involved in cell wall biosynthesis
MERVLQTIPHATMALVGVPSHTALDAQVADFISSRGLSQRIKLLGLVSNEVLWQEWERASVLLIPSLEETAPIAIGEACAVGIPQVGSNGGGIPYMIRENETGFILPVGDVAGMAERVTAILQDSTLRQRLATASREIGQQEFSLAAIARKTAAAYREILTN